MPEHARPPRRKQDQRYWDRMAERWDREIFNTLYHDKSRVITTELKRSSVGARSVADFGCGTWLYFPLLCRLFQEVQGFERSRACVRIATARFRKHAGIAVHPASTATRRRGAFDVVLCVNVVIHPSVRGRMSVMGAVRSLLVPGGTLILVVPSLESATMVARVEQRALRRQGRPGTGDWDVDTDRHGVVAIEGLPTKHFTRPELRDTLERLGWKVSRVRRVPYSWQSQGVRPGPGGRRRLPWDWIAVARR
ncbi:MAG: methyltransferase domain-containing protein [Gemmatimonadales bacterium]